jgi:DNA-binding LytR/AlgR family response regulator
MEPRMKPTLRVVLADDEPLALERLQHAFRDIPATEIAGSASNGVQALEMITALKPDLAILDIQMPGRTGLRVAAAVPLEERPEIIFLTAYDNHAVDAFDLDAADYVLKPLQLDRLRQAVERARRRRFALAPKAPPPEVVAEPQADPADSFWVSGRQGLIRVPLEQVDWIEAAKDYVLLHTATRSHMLRATMASIEGRFPPPALVRVHRSALVRPQAVQAIHPSPSGAGAVVLADGVAVPIGPSYQHEVMRLVKA